MNTRKNWFITWGTLLFLLTAGVVIAAAQTDTCDVLVRQAFAALNECAAAPGGSACFGADAEMSGSGSFAEAGDVISLADFTSIHTMPLDLNAEQWGIAALNVPANVPLSLSEQGVKFFLLGDVEVENAVDPASAFVPAPSIKVTALVAANIRSAPSTEARVVANAPTGTELTADGLSADNAWLRVLIEDGVAWISRQVVAPADGADIDSLPVIGPNTWTLMQSIFLRTGESASDCAGAPPSVLLAQAPGGLNAGIAVNGVDIRFNSAIALRVLPDNIMQLFVLSGTANMSGVSVPTGFTLNIPLDDDGQQPSGAATGLRPITDEERTLLTPLTAGFSGDLLYAELSVPSQEEVSAILASLNGASAAGGTASSGPAAGQADCARFKPTSPLDGLAFGPTPFYWDAAPGATSYRINIFGQDGGLRAAIDATTTSTTYTFDTGGNIGGGDLFSWNVEALVNGEVACTSGRVTVPRQLQGQAVGTGNNNGGQAQCSWNDPGCTP